MGVSRRLFPFHRLPPGYARSLDGPAGPPSLPRPAATLVLLRSAPGGIETLLLRRSARHRFIPGAWVFPGGRVDPADGDPSLLERLAGVDVLRLGKRLGLLDPEPGSPAGGHPPAAAFVVAALREAFEETGLLLAGRSRKPRGTTPVGISATEEVRLRLLQGRTSFREVLAHLDTELDARAVEYVAHWTTPEAEPLRFDTRFFAAEASRESRVTLLGEEMLEARWVSPEEALARNEAGGLPLVFPTLRTLETLTRFRTPRDFLRHHETRAIPHLLPTLLRRKEGIEIILEEPE